jgi:hypothetical protein
MQRVDDVDALPDLFPKGQLFLLHRARKPIKFSSVSSRELPAELSVVHLKIRHRATGLTPPAVATQDLLAQTFVRRGIQP